MILESCIREWSSLKGRGGYIMRGGGGGGGQVKFYLYKKRVRKSLSHPEEGGGEHKTF